MYYLSRGLNVPLESPISMLSPVSVSPVFLQSAVSPSCPPSVFAALFEVHASLQCLQHLHTQCGYFLFKVWEVLYCEISLLNSWTDVWKNIFRGFSTVKHSREINSLYQTIFIWHLLICYISIALFWVLRALYIVRGVSPRPPPVCSIHLDDATAAILRQNAHHTPAYWWRGDRVMKPISVWGWLRGHDGQRPMGKFGQDAGVTPLLFFEGHPGIFLWPQRVRTSV